MTRFLLELACEEIPARMQAAAATQLARRFTEACAAAGLAHGEVTADATPRRLWLVAEDVAPASAAVAEERRGPRADAPEAALAGFLRSTGLTREQLEERDTGKGVFLFAVLHREGQPAAAVLGGMIPAIVAAFDWPKSMRWGAASASTASPRWVRPLTHMVALLGEDVVDCAVHGKTSGRETPGHRVHAPGIIRLASADRYEEQLRAAHVIVQSAERRALIAEGAAALAAAAGLTLVPDEGLVAENAGLTEWPVPLLGHFDLAFLEVPREIIQLTMRTNQKYFAATGTDGALAPAFVCVANLVASDGGGAIIAGNERVLSARLADARFFWEQDLAVVREGGLEAFLPKLEGIVFHEKLGTMADKVARVAKLARWLVDTTMPGTDPALAERAALLCKADLLSATVGEFPELQGIVGGYLATAAGESPEIAHAIVNHYRPAGPNDYVPTESLSIVVAIADKLDTLFSFFAIAEKPTGSRDPYALRRAALGVIALLVTNNIRISIIESMMFGIANLGVAIGRNQSKEIAEIIKKLDNTAYSSEKLLQSNKNFLGLSIDDWEKNPFLKATKENILSAPQELANFLTDRLKVQQREAGMRPDIIDAVFALGEEDDLVRLIGRVTAIQDIIATIEGANLLAGYRRAANILSAEAAKDGPHTAAALDPARLAEPAEVALAVALDAALPRAEQAVAAEDFAAAMAALASLRPPVDAFFTDLMVNAADPVVRRNRLALLARFRDAVHTVADFSRIEG